MLLLSKVVFSSHIFLHIHSHFGFQKHKRDEKKVVKKRREGKEGSRRKWWVWLFKILQIAPQLIIFSHSHKKKEKDYDNDDVEDDDDMNCELKGSFEGGGGSAKLNGG